MLAYALKLRFHNPSDEPRLMNVLRAERDVFNFASSKHFTGGPVKNSIIDLHEKTYFPYRELHPGTPAQVVIIGQRSCLAAYKSVKANKHKLSGPLVKKRLSIKLDKRSYRLKGNDVFITAMDGKRIECFFKPFPKFDSLRKIYPLGDPTISIKNGEIWISFAFKTPDPIPDETKTIVGVDLGKRRMACTSEGKMISAKPFNAAKRKIRYLKRSLQSKGTKSAKRHLKKVGRKERNVSKHYVHACVNEILKTDANVIVVENLASLKKPKKLSRTQKERFKNRNNISQVPFNLIKETLVYKARNLRKEVETVNPYMTSQSDYRNEKPGVRKGCRYYTSDGLVFDADIHAAINIAKKSSFYNAEHPTSFSMPIDGGFRPCGQANVNWPSVYHLRCGGTDVLNSVGSHKKLSKAFETSFSGTCH